MTACVAFSISARPRADLHSRPGDVVQFGDTETTRGEFDVAGGKQRSTHWSCSPMACGSVTAQPSGESLCLVPRREATTTLRRTSTFSLSCANRLPRTPKKWFRQQPTTYWRSPVSTYQQSWSLTESSRRPTGQLRWLVSFVQEDGNNALIDPESAAHQFLQQATTTLEEARVLLAANHPSGAINRSYYAAFYAACALLDSVGLEARSHKAVITLLQSRVRAFGQT